MNSDLKRTPNRRRAVAIQMAGGYVNKIIVIIQGLLFIPLFLNFIGDRIYGLWLASGGVLAWLAFMDMGVAGLLIQRISRAYGRGDYKQVVDYFVNGLAVYMVLDLLFFFFVFGLSFFIPDWFGAKGDEVSLLRACFQLAGIVAGIEFLNNCLRGFAEALLRPLFPIIVIIIFRILGLIITVALLYQGYGLWAIPIGLLANVIPILLLNILYSIHLIRNLGKGWRINRDIIRDFYQIGPALLAGRVGTSIVKNIEPTLIAIFFSPELVTIFVINRRAADMIEQFLQVINSSTFPSFVHQYALGDIKKSRHTVSIIMTLIFSACLIAFGTYIAGNQSFLTLWVGSKNFSGELLSVLIALGLLMMFVSQLISRLLIGTGDIFYPSLLTLAEAMTRVLLMVCFLYPFGLIGLPLGMVISCSIFGLIYYRRLDTKLSLSFFYSGYWLRTCLLLGLFFIICFWVAQQKLIFESWLCLSAYLSGISCFLAILLLLCYPSFRSLVVEFSFSKILKSKK